MNKVLSLALVGAGPLSRSGIARLPGLREHLAYVKASSVRVASRLVNNLHAGAAVKRYEDLDECRIFLVCVPPGQARAVVDDMASSDLDWRQRMVALWDVPMSSAEMLPLERSGASTATLTPVSEADPRRLVIEGNREAVRSFRRIFDTRNTRMIEVRTEWKALFGAGVTFATSLYTPLIHCCFESLRGSGLTSTEAAAITELILNRTLRSYLKAGPKGWAGPIPGHDDDSVARHIAVLGRFRPSMRRFYLSSARGACEIWPRETRWLRDILDAAEARGI